MPEPVIIVDYSPEWARQFAKLRSTLLAALGNLAVAVEHVGSTAVPGLASKPIIDIDVVVASFDELDRVKAALGNIGYEYAGEQGIAGRHAFKQPAGLPQHHCYVCVSGGRELLRHLAFRDALRTDAELAREYAALKTTLAAQYREDRLGYSEAKGAFVEAVLRQR